MLGGKIDPAHNAQSFSGQFIANFQARSIAFGRLLQDLIPISQLVPHRATTDGQPILEFEDRV